MASNSFSAAFLVLLCACGCSVRVGAGDSGCLPNSRNISTLFGAGNASVMLESGTYCMEAFAPVANLPAFSLLGATGNSSDVVIRCAEGVGLAFLNISESFEMVGVTVSDCGLSGSGLVDFLQQVNLTLNYYYNPGGGVSIAVLMAAVRNANITDVRVMENLGFGLLAVSLYGTGTFLRAEFTNNAAPDIESIFNLPNQFQNFGRYTAGGAIFQFHDWRDGRLIEPVSLNIDDCSFSNNTNYYALDGAFTYLQSSPTLLSLGYVITGAAGLTIKLDQQAYTVNMTVQGSTISHNQATLGGGATVTSARYVQNSAVTFRNCDFYNNRNSSGSSAGMALLLSFNLWYWNSTLQASHVAVRFEQSRFVGNVANTGGAVHAQASTEGLVRRSSQHDVVFLDCLFHVNQAAAGAAVSIYLFESVAFNSAFVFAFDNCTFSGQTVTAQSSLSASFSGSGAIQLRNAFILLRNTIIRDTNGSGIQSLDSTIAIEGSVSFVNNAAFNGGAVQLSGFSYFVIRNGSHLAFRRNTAFEFGGALYFSLPQNFLVSSSNFDCILYPNNFDPFCLNDCDLDDLDFVVEFDENSAEMGSMIHGALLDTCTWAYNLSAPLGPGGVGKPHVAEQLRDNYSAKFIFDQPFHPTGINTNALSANVRVSADNSTAISAMPGEQIPIMGTALDQLGSRVGDVLIARISGSSFNSTALTAKARVGPNGLWRLNGESTSTLRVDGPRDCTFEVSLSSSVSHAGSILTVNLTECRPGFTYNHTSSRCECDQNLVQYGSLNFRCDDTDSSFSVRHNYWFGQLRGLDRLQNDGGPFIVGLCGGIGCRNSLLEASLMLRSDRLVRDIDFVSVNPEQLDEQCIENRNGLFCGRCKPGYSVKLTSVECADCSGTAGAVLVLLFALMGVLLMAVLTISDFHISSGYINGLIFYSNLTDLFYIQLTGRIDGRVFILYEWLSLRWGIPVCFFDGMDRLTQTGLEYIFPLYLMFLLIVVAVVSRYCPIPQKYRNAINLPKMFATTLALTFVSILGTSIQILGFIVVPTSDPSITTVHWRKDPNIRFFQHPRHIVLGIISIFAVLYLVMCTLMVMIPEKFCYSMWCRKKIRSYKPITDCLKAPFRDNYLCRTWEGWRFLFRLLIILVGFAPRSVSTWVLVAIVIVLLYFQTALHPYKIPIQNWLDSLFLLVFVMTTMYILALDFFDVVDPVFLIPMYVLQGIVWVVITGIFFKCFFRCLKKLWHQLKKCYWKKKAKKGMYSINGSSSGLKFTDSTILTDTVKHSEEPRESVVEVEDVRSVLPKFSQLREGLLTYDSDEDEAK